MKGLQGFVGMINFYRTCRLIPLAAQTMAPLFKALTGKPKALVWNEAVVKFFHDTKNSLPGAALLARPHQNAPVSLTMDTSDLAVRAVLQQ